MKFITIGADPEFFVLDPKGEPFPATPFAAGTKDLPVAIGDGFYEQRDNLSFEGNIPPATTKEKFISYMIRLRTYFADKVAKYGYSLSSNGVEYFKNRYNKTPEGMEFGCSKVISSWDSTFDSIHERPTPVLEKLCFRVAGFHIHIGYDSPLDFGKENTDILIGRLFDLFLTIPSQVIKPEPERIRTYGKYGMIRSKSYGVECRTLSSYFTQAEHLGWVWDQVMKIEQFINASTLQDLKTIINHAYFLGEDPIYVEKRFYYFFNDFKDKTVIDKFNETKKIYERKDFLVGYDSSPISYFTSVASA